jgi:endonuclease YncB( thermonuclease family)
MNIAATLGLAALIGATAAVGWWTVESLPISGRATVVDGDTIRVGSARVRLFGVDAPESAQTCLDAQRREYACGVAATNALQRMLDRDPVVTCDVRDTDKHGRSIARCSNSGGDLGARLVMAGWATAYVRYSRAYVDQQDAAKGERAGMWGGTFFQPEQYRMEHKR